MTFDRRQANKSSNLFNDTLLPPRLAKSPHPSSSPVPPTHPSILPSPPRIVSYIHAQFPADSRRIVLSTSCKSTTGTTSRNRVRDTRRYRGQKRRQDIACSQRSPLSGRDPRPSTTGFSRSSDTLLPFRGGSPCILQSALPKALYYGKRDIGARGCQSPLPVLLPLPFRFSLLSSFVCPQTRSSTRPFLLPLLSRLFSIHLASHSSSNRHPQEDLIILMNSRNS